MTREHNAEPLLLFRRCAGRVECIFDRFLLAWNASAQLAHGFYPGYFTKFRFKCSILVRLIEAKVDHQDLILVESHILVVNKVKLFVHNPDTNDERYGNYKLAYNQRFPEKILAATDSRLSFQNFRWRKRRQYQGRIAPCQ